MLKNNISIRVRSGNNAIFMSLLLFPKNNVGKGKIEKILFGDGWLER